MPQAIVIADVDKNIVAMKQYCLGVSVIARAVKKPRNA